MRMRTASSIRLWQRHDDRCVSCDGEGRRIRRSDRFRYRYCVDVIEPVRGSIVGASEEVRADPMRWQYARPHYLVARCVIGSVAERGSWKDGEKQFLTACGRFRDDSDPQYARSFVSDREADRVVDRLASGMPVFVTRATAVAATIGVALPAWLAFLT